MKKITLFNKLLIFLTFVFLGTNIQSDAQTLMPIPPISYLLSSPSSAGGYWFIAPVAFTMTGLELFSTSLSDPQIIQVVKIHSGGLAIYPSTSTNFTTLYYINNAPNNTVQPVSISVNAGDTIGLLGRINTNQAYSTAVAPYTTTIGGASVVLNRFTYSGNINLSQALEYSSAASGELGLVKMYYTTELCTGQPSAGTIPTTLGVCSAAPFTLTPVGATLEGDIVSQWQSRNPAGTGTWMDIPSATMLSFTSTGITTPTDFRYISKCTPSGLSDTTNVLTTTFNLPNQCYCTPATLNGYQFVYLDSVILQGDVLPGIINTLPNFSAIGYNDYTTMSATLTAGFTYSGNITSGYGGNKNVRIWIDYNNDGIFQSTEQIAALANLTNVPGIGAFSFTVPITQAAGTFRMRVRLVNQFINPANIDPCILYGFGEAQDYTVNIIASTPCTGTPSAGTVTSTLAICKSVPFTIATIGSTLAENMDNQWQSRNPAGTGVWANIAGASSASYTIAGITTPTDYRYISKCITSGLSDTSNVMTTTINPFNQCYCTPSGSSPTYYINSFSTALGSTNIANNASGYTTNGYGNFTSNQTVTQDIGGAVSFNAVYGTSSNTYGTKIWVDWNQDGDFSDPGEMVYSSTIKSSSENGIFTVPATALTGATRMRIGISFLQATGPTSPCQTGVTGEFEDYTFMVTIPPCAVPSAFMASNVNATTATISWTAASPAPANGYEYYLSTSIITPTAATVATGITAAGIVTKNLTALSPNTTYYLWLRAACSVNNKSDWTLPLSFTTPCLSATIPYTAPLAAVTPPAIPDCMNTELIAGGAWTTANAPGSGFTGNTLTSNYGSTTNNSWVYTNGLALTAGTSYRLKYDYGNYDNYYTEKLEVKYGLGSTSANMTSQLADHPNINSATLTTNSVDFIPTTTGIYYIGFKSYSDAYQDRIFLANITVTLSPPPCTGIPSAGLISGPASVCPEKEIELITTEIPELDIAYQWQVLPSGASNWQDILNATNLVYVDSNGIATATAYRFIAFCTNSNESDTSAAINIVLKPGFDCICEPKYQFGCGEDDDIKDVVLVGDVYPGIQNLNTPCPNSGYEDYSNLSATLTAGNTYTGFVTTSNSYAPQNVRIWINYNNNGQFEEEETVGLLSDLLEDSLGNYTFTVPDTIPTGSYKMRVRLVPDTDPEYIDPCSTENRGEAHDYTIEIISRPACSGSPDAGLISGPDSVCPDRAFDLIGSFLPQGNMSYQWQKMPNSTTLWFDIPTANGLVYHENNGINELTYYRLVATCVNNNEKDTSNVFTVALSPNSECACIPQYDYGCVYGDGIKDVRLQGDEVVGIENLNTPCPPNGYGNYLNLSTTVTPGNTYSGNVTTYSSYAGARIWIDYNQNGTYEISEIIATMADLDELSTGAFTFTVPPLTLPGNYKMRIRVVSYEDANTIDPCDMYGGGSAHDYTIVVPSPMSITLKYLSAENKGNINLIDWETLSEEEGDHFEIERSIDGRNFEVIGYQNGVGQPNTYHFIDKKPVPSLNFYRLDLLNRDGSKKYSKIVHATVKMVNFSLKAYPNPMSDLVTIKVYGTLHANATIAILDPIGRVVKTQKVTQPEVDVSMSGMASGLYIIKYNDDVQNAVLKLIKE